MTLSPQLRVALLVGTIVAVNASGFLLARAAREDDIQADLDPKAVEQVAESLSKNREQLKELFTRDATQAAESADAFESKGEQLDAQRVQEMLAGELTDVDLLSNAPDVILSKLSKLDDRMQIQSEISERISVASFESAVLDKQTKLVGDAAESLAEQRKKLTEKYKDLLSAADEASSYVNNLPPM